MSNENLIMSKISFYNSSQRESNVNQDEHIYSDSLGYWVDNNGLPSVSNDEFKKPKTKKCDIETGEDKKGE